MFLEFFNQQIYTPQDFDILMHPDGTITVLAASTMNDRHLRILLEPGNKTPTAHQILAIYGFISRYKFCGVALYGMDL